MAITTVDGLVAGLVTPEEIYKSGATMEAAGVMHSLFYTAGRPGAAVAPSPGIGGAALTSYAGQIPFTNPGSGNSYLARAAACASVIGTLLVCDRLWHNSGIAVATTTAQTVNSATFPARDQDGATDGNGVMVGLEVSAATTNGAANTTMSLSYTNEAGTAGHAATVGAIAPGAFPATAVAGTFVPFLLAAGDKGVRSIQSITLAVSLGGGTVHLVAYRVLARIPITAANIAAVQDFAQTGLPRLYDNTVPFLLWVPSATTGVTINASLQVAQG